MSGRSLRTNFGLRCAGVEDTKAEGEFHKGAGEASETIPRAGSSASAMQLPPGLDECFSSHPVMRNISATEQETLLLRRRRAHPAPTGPDDNRVLLFFSAAKKRYRYYPSCTWLLPVNLFPKSRISIFLKKRQKTVSIDKEALAPPSHVLQLMDTPPLRPFKAVKHLLLSD